MKPQKGMYYAQSRNLKYRSTNLKDFDCEPALKKNMKFLKQNEHDNISQLEAMQNVLKLLNAETNRATHSRKHIMFCNEELS